MKTPPPSSISHWLQAAYKHPDVQAVKFKKNQTWRTLSFKEYLQSIAHIQSILRDHNITSGQKVALMSNTRWEWAAIDVATLAQSSILVPIYPNLSDDDVTYILNHCEADLLFVDTAKTHEQFERIKKNLNKSISCLIIDDYDFTISSISDQIVIKMIDASQNVKLNDPVTIIYTSGTTGKPKGVLLQHKALVSEVYEAFSLFEIKHTDSSLAFLPFAHVMGRVEHWGGLFKLCQVAYAESIDQLKSNLVEIKPSFLIAVPRIFEKVYAGILTKVETSILQKKIFFKALEIAKQMQYYRETNQAAPITIAVSYEVLAKAVFTPIKKAFGGQLRFAISGGAPLSKELGLFFANLGIKVLEGYGLTETFAAITVNTEQKWQLGTVGQPIGDVEIKFDHDGEILVRSHKILKEYYNNPEATQEAFDKEGFFRTGDIGEFDQNGYLKITDRKKDLIKTAGGKYVAPQKLEGLLKQEPSIAQVLICGDQKKFVTAILTVENLSVDATSEEKQNLINKLTTHVQKVNSVLASFEAIKKFEVVFETWSVDNGCLTPSMKVKRKFVQKRYEHLINQMYED